MWPKMVVLISNSGNFSLSFDAAFIAPPCSPSATTIIENDFFLSFLRVKISNSLEGKRFCVFLDEICKSLGNNTEEFRDNIRNIVNKISENDPELRPDKTFTKFKIKIPDDKYVKIDKLIIMNIYDVLGEELINACTFNDAVKIIDEKIMICEEFTKLLECFDKKILAKSAVYFLRHFDKI